MYRSLQWFALPMAGIACWFPATRLQAASTTAYVTLCCNAPSTAGVFHATTLKQTKTIATGSGGDGIALSPDGSKMFVTVDNTPELEVISTATGAILAHVPVPIAVSGTPPLELGMSLNGAHVYVFAPQNDPNSSLMAVDTTTYQVTASHNLPFNESLGPLLVSPDGKQLYFEVGLVNQYIQVIDAAKLHPVEQIPINVNPSGMAITPSGLILITDTNNELLVVDPQSSSIVNRFPLPKETSGLPGQVIASPDSNTAYISFVRHSILAVDFTTGAVLFDAPIDYGPAQFAISPYGDRIYSLNFSTNGAYSISEFYIPTQKPLYTVRQLGPLSAIALTRDGSNLYALNANNSAIAAVDVATHQPGPVTLGGLGLNSVAIPSNSSTVWASSYQFSVSGNILLLDPATGKLAFTNGQAGGLSFSPNGSVVYAASPGAIAALDVQSMHTLAKHNAANLENIGQAIASPDGKSLYVSVTFVSGMPINNGKVLHPQGDIVVLDPSTLKHTATIGIPDGLGSIALTEDGKTLVCTSNRGHVHVIDTATRKITGTIQVSPSNSFLTGVALSSDGSKAYVTDTQNNQLLVLDLTKLAHQSSFGVGSQPIDVAITPDGSEAWVLGAAGLQTVTLSDGAVNGPINLPGTPSAIAFSH